MRINNKQMTFCLFVALSLSLLLAGCGSSSSAPSESSTPESSSGSTFEYDFQLTTPLGDSHTAAIIWNELFEELSEKTDGRLTGTVFTNSQLGSGDMITTVDMVQKGSIDIGVLGSPLLGGYVPEFRLPSMPFLFNSFEAADQTLNDDAIMQYFTEGLTENNFYFLGWMENTWNEMTNNKKELIVPEDMEGLTMRVPVNDIVSAAYAQAGASILDMSLNELYTSLQQGVVDGQDNGVSGAITANKLYEVQQYMNYSQYAYGPFAVVMNQDLWEEVPADDQALITELFNKYAPIQIQQNRDSMVENLNFVIEEGMIVHEMTPEEREEWRKVMGPESPGVQEVLKGYDQDFVELLIETAKAN